MSCCAAPAGRQHDAQQQQQQHLQQHHLDPHKPLQQLSGQESDLGNSIQQPHQQQQASRTAAGNSRAASLARALQLHPRQAASMLLDYPPLSDFNHARLADKLYEMACLLQLQPQQLSAALVQDPRLLGASLQAFEQRVGMLVRLFGGVEAVQEVGGCCCERCYSLSRCEICQSLSLIDGHAFELAISWFAPS
jgi:hypothetical protein